jgi:mevalonate kinase
MINNEVLETVERNRNSAMGWKLSGAGGGGYLVLVSEKEIVGTFRIKIRRKGSTAD